MESFCDAVSNMQEKMEDPEFTNDMQSHLHLGVSFNARLIHLSTRFIDKMDVKRDSRLYILKHISIIKECMIIFD